MIRIRVASLLAKSHANFVINRVRKMGNEDLLIAYIQKLGVNYLEDFLTADVETMRSWVQKYPERLQFTQFKDIYSKYFCNGSEKFVDEDYNAYKFVKNMGLTVCPYCDNEYLDMVYISEKMHRTSEIDHFFAKSKYPALAMCFYNLVPSGQLCNGIKLNHEIGANPYEKDIEHLTFLYPNIPVGILMEKVKVDDCKVLFHPQKGMRENVIKLGLEQRYERYAPEVYRLLKNSQNYSEEKIQELVKLGCGTREEIISSNFGPQDPKEKKNTLRQKMLRDLTGY